MEQSLTQLGAILARGRREQKYSKIQENLKDLRNDKYFASGTVDVKGEIAWAPTSKTAFKRATDKASYHLSIKNIFSYENATFCGK